MSFSNKDARNKKFTRAENLIKKGNPLDLERKLNKVAKRLNQRIKAVDDHLDKVDDMQKRGDMNYFDLIKHNYSEVAMTTHNKIEKITKKIDCLNKTNKNYKEFQTKGQQKIKDLDYRLNVKMY